MTYEECVEVIEKAEREGATELNLSRQGLEKLPTEIGRLTQLTSLDLRNNQLSELPETLTALTQLTSLHLYGNQLSELPESLSRLTQLTSLYLADNQLSELPESLGQLSQLTSLNLRNNQLTDLPKSVTRLTQLTELNLNNNQLTEVPQFLSELRNLKELDLRGNEGLPLSPEILENFEDAPAILKHIEEIADLKLELEDSMASLADDKEKKVKKKEPHKAAPRPEPKVGEKKEPPKSPGATERGKKPATKPSAEPGRVLAGFQSDSIGIDDKDKLDIEGVVEAFCSVMLSQKVHPPLSIGLFGDWGSGKSFFMEEMWRQVKALAEEARDKDSPDWHGHVAQIRFNAWHYSDANLWASFVTHMFDELAKIINPGPTLQETRGKLLQHLETSKALREEAEYELVDAHSALEQRKGVLQQQRDDLQAKRQTLASIKLHDIQAMVADPAYKEEAEQLKTEADELSKKLGIGRAWETADQLSQVVDQAKSISGRVRGLWADFRGDRSRVTLALAVILLFLPALFVVADPVLHLLEKDGISGFFDRAKALWLQGLILLGGVGKFLAAATSKLNQLDRFRGRLTALAREREEALLKPAQDEVDALQTRVTQAEAAAVRADQRVSEAERAVRDASAGRRFYRFIEERAASHDYRKHLGLISMVHRDFEQLGELLKDCDPYVAEKPEGNRGADSVNEGGEVRAVEEAVEENDKVAKIERIILYIDDLDRCRPEVVVETLQAVHLLLALPLFVVVAGVDSRWLLRALEVHYPEFLSVGSRRRTGTRQETKDGKPNKEEDENNATTPQNYLEKIFQIPFCLPEMEEHGFGRLIEALANPAEKETPGKDSGAPGAAGVKPQGAGTPPPATPPAGPGKPPATPSPKPADPSGGKKKGAAAPGGRPPPLPKKPLPSPRVLEISEDERLFMKTLHPLIETPRATKRFVNVYRLLRAVSVKDEEAFLQTGYRAALTLLALNMGSPSLARHVFDELYRRAATGSWEDLVKALTPQRDGDGWKNEACGGLSGEEPADWKRITDYLGGLLSEMPGELKTYQDWAPAIARFAFWPQEKSLAESAGRDEESQSQGASAPHT